MEPVFVVMAVVWVLFGLVSAARRSATAAEEAARRASDHALHAGERVQLPGRTALPVPVGRFGMLEESTSEDPLDELAEDTELQLERAAQAEVHSLEPNESREMVLTTTEARPLPAVPVSLEHEVDRIVEHQRFHQRYVAAKAPPHHAHRGLLEDMRDPGAVRRGLLMAEILGPPVGLHGLADPSDR